MKLFPDRLFRDVIPPAGVAFADYTGVHIPVEGTFLCAYVMTPDGTYDRPCPCVILCHGFPGFYKNDDIAQALCRMGCVVIVPGCRGGWSSGGFYSFTNYITDIITTAHWACSPEIVQTYGIDPNSVFLSGHSVGGSSALNAARQLPWLKGVIAIAPYDLSYLFDETSCGIDFLLEIGAGVLREETPGAIQRNAMACHRNLALEQAFGIRRPLRAAGLAAAGYPHTRAHIRGQQLDSRADLGYPPSKALGIERSGAGAAWTTVALKQVAGQRFPLMAAGQAAAGQPGTGVRIRSEELDARVDVGKLCRKLFRCLCRSCHNVSSSRLLICQMSRKPAHRQGRTKGKTSQASQPSRQRPPR